MSERESELELRDGLWYSQSRSLGEDTRVPAVGLIGRWLQYIKMLRHNWWYDFMKFYKVNYQISSLFYK